MSNKIVISFFFNQINSDSKEITIDDINIYNSLSTKSEKDIVKIFKLSSYLFDNISSTTSSKLTEENEKTEPVISANIEDTEDAADTEETSNLEKIESNDEIEPEFNASNDESDEDFNQETEEDLLDIPTFLRRQAN